MASVPIWRYSGAVEASVSTRRRTRLYVVDCFALLTAGLTIWSL